MFYKLLILSMFFLLTSASANILKDIKTFEANFEQKIINPSDKEIVYKGHLFIKEPSNILWQYKQPVIKNVYIINNVAVIDEPELEQAIFSRLKNEIDILQLIKTAKKIDNNRYLAKVYDVDYTLITKNNKIEKIEYKDTLENKVTILFNDVVQNSFIDDEVFKFLPPENYDIIRK